MKTTKPISIAVCLLTCVHAMLVLAGCSDRDENEPGSEGTQAKTMVEPETDLPPAWVELETDLPSIYKDNPIPRRKPAEPFLVPQGTKLLSRGVEVTSSDAEPVIGKLEMVTDGNEETQGYHDSYVELAPGLQWVQLDLGKPHALHAILVWHDYGRGDFFPWEYGWQQHVYQDVVVQVSNDSRFKEGVKPVKTVFNNDHDNSSGLGYGLDDIYIETSEGRWINPEGVEGRYVRLYSRGYNVVSCRFGNASGGTVYDELNRYIEVEVHGK